MEYEQLTLDIDGMQNNSLADEQPDRPYTLLEKIEEAKRTLKLAAEMSRIYYNKPLIVTYSGGKDSDVMLHLAEIVLKPNEFEVQNSHTTVDAPETVYHIRDVFKRLNRHGIKASIDYHIEIIDGKKTPITMWNLIPRKLMPPTRIARYCCAILKESSTSNRIISLGVREEESTNRTGRDIFSSRGNTYKDAKFYSLAHAEEVHKEAQEINNPVWDCMLIENMRKHNEILVNPIYYWSEADIWDYIRQNNITTNPLYGCKYHRIGCIGCPLATYKKRIRQLADYPKFVGMYTFAFEKMINEKKKRGLKIEWKTGKEVFDWWIEEYKHNVKGQLSIFKEG